MVLLPHCWYWPRSMWPYGVTNHNELNRLPWLVTLEKTRRLYMWGRSRPFHIYGQWFKPIHKINSIFFWRDGFSQTTKFMGPTWGSPGSCRPQMVKMLAPWTLLAGLFSKPTRHQCGCTNALRITDLSLNSARGIADNQLRGRAPNIATATEITHKVCFADHFRRQIW